MTNTNLPAGHLADADAQRLVDGTLAADEAPEAERHVLGCALCGATVESYRLLASALDDLDVPPLPADFTDGVLARIEAADRALARERRHALAILAGAVAAAAAAFAVAGPAAWAPAFSSAAEVLGGVVHALQVGGSFVPKVLDALRFQIILVVGLIALPLLLALVRLMPAPPPQQTELA